MKNVLRLLILAAAVASFTLPAFAQDTPAAGAASVCTSEADAKAALYQKFLANYKGTPEQQKIANETGREYVNKYGTCPDEGDKKIATFIQNWNTKYEKAVRDFACTDAFIKKDYAKTFEACRVILNTEPDNVDTVLLLARAGYANMTSPAPNKTLNADAARMARRAIELIESGKAPAKWEPFPSRDEALGFLYYAQGVFTQETSPTDAAATFIKAAQSNSLFKREYSTYTYLANIYETNELKKLIDEYKATFPPGNPIPDEKKPQYDQMLLQIGKVQDRIIDAYARAASILNADPKADPNRKKAVMNQLTQYYKARHEDSDAGLQELVNNVLSRPLPIPGQEPAAPAAPASSSGMNGTNGAGTTPVGQPVSNTVTPTPAAGTAPKPAVTPATTPAKPAATTTAPASTTPKPKPLSKKSTPAFKSSRGRKTTSGR
jgi:hypothetical protein